jgi:hypothetical protein
VVGIVRAWESVDAVTALESGEDIYDPYFFVSLDIYYSGTLPTRAEREQQLRNVFAFESLEPDRKDRFLLDEIPFRLEYKEENRFSDLLQKASENAAHLREGGTYPFYRLVHARQLYAQGDWLQKTRDAVMALPDSFWVQLRETYQARMEHDLNDLAAAVVREDPLFYSISLADFMRSACSCLLAINHRFEPADRRLAETVRSLEVVPESFRGRFDSLIRQEADLTPERKSEIATHFAKSIVAL